MAAVGAVADGEAFPPVAQAPLPAIFPKMAGEAPAPQMKGQSPTGPYRRPLPVHLVVRTNVEEDDFFRGDANDRQDPDTVSQRNGVHTLVPAL